MHPLGILVKILHLWLRVNFVADVIWTRPFAFAKIS